MKTATSQMKAFLLAQMQHDAPSQYFMADLFTFTLLGGGVVRYTNGGSDIVFGGNTFSSLGPFLNRTACRETIGLEVAEMTITVIADPSHEVFTQPFLQALANGTFDSCDVLVQRLYMETYGDVSNGAIIRFKGKTADIVPGRIKATINARSRTELLNTQLPFNLFQPSCRHALYDAGCTLNRASFGVAASVSSGSNRSVIQTSLTQPNPITAPVSAPTITQAHVDGTNLILRPYFAKVTYTNAYGETLPSPEGYLAILANNIATVDSPPPVTGATGWNVYVGLEAGAEQKQNGGSAMTIGVNWTEPKSGLVQGGPSPQSPTNGYFKQGVVVFTSGANNGEQRVIVDYTSGALSVIPPLLAVPSPGDTFVAYSGCSKDLATCQNKFSNAQHFGGQPWIPAPITAIAWLVATIPLWPLVQNVLRGLFTHCSG